MAYVPTSEYQGEIDELISEICKSLIFQEEYKLNVSGFAHGKRGELEEREPNFEALNHVHSLLLIHKSPGIGWLVQFNTHFIGKIHYWKECKEHYITNQSHMDTKERIIHMNTIISVRRLLEQIIDQTAEQVRRLEKVLFCFET